MSEQIKVGDLVYVDKVMPCGHGRIGYTFTVTKIRASAAGGTRCTVCGTMRHNLVVAERDDGTGRVCEISRLKRIPPMSQLEHFRTEELLRRDVKEPA